MSGTYPVFAKFVHILTSRNRVFVSGLSGSRSGSMCPTRNIYPKSSAWHTPESQRASAKVSQNFWVTYSNVTDFACCRHFGLNYSNMTCKAAQLMCWCEAGKNLANSEYLDGLNGADNRPLRQNPIKYGFVQHFDRALKLCIPGCKSVLRKGFYEI